MQVFHPLQPAIQGRSGWPVMPAGRRPFPAPQAWLPAQGRRSIYALHEADQPDAIPAGIVIARSGQARTGADADAAARAGISLRAFLRPAAIAIFAWR